MNDQPEHEQSEDGGHDLPLADHPLTAGRLAQHQARVAEGAYPYRFERTATAAELHAEYSELEPAAETEVNVAVAGRAEPLLFGAPPAGLDGRRPAARQSRGRRCTGGGRRTALANVPGTEMAKRSAVERAEAGRHSG